LAGVKEEIGSKLSDTAAGRFFVLAAKAGVSNRPPAAMTASSVAFFRSNVLDNAANSLFKSRYSLRRLKVP
jgi:hypothetical protein